MFKVSQKLEIMEEWQKNLIEILETVVDEVEHFLFDVAEAVDSFVVISGEVANELHNTISTDLEQFFNAIVDPLLDNPDSEFPENLFEHEWQVSEPEESLFVQHPACVGCRHFHGQYYGGNLLVCGMHPYGWDSENCPDWESDERMDNNHNSPFLF